MSSLATNDSVQHPRFGRGLVEFPKGGTALVRFAHGIEECLSTELRVVRTPEHAYGSGQYDGAAELVTKLQAETILSINSSWGVFSPTRIDLFPHQLWVCKKVTEQWPIRWVIADDVGLGKTIEAGLILWRIFHLKLVRRMLILCPAALVAQWQKRMLDMFDIRLSAYVSQIDTEQTDFWRLHDHVVASFHTLRDDRSGRHERMFNAEGWDIVLVDEAHHLNHDEQTGMTLGHQLVRKLDQAKLVSSILLFTGTPHRGKHFGFFALMALVRPDLFDPRRPAESQMGNLRQALIRNNKYCVTDLSGNRLFREPIVRTEKYSYSEAEDRFYSMMTEFVETGRAYASSLSLHRGQAVKLVLIALQKLASSSVAAIRAALKKRLMKLSALEHAVTERMMPTASDDDDDTKNRQIEDEMATIALELMKDECARLTELIAAADAVRNETKIEAIIASVRALSNGESVLFFTEYKATQAMLLAALWREFGPNCASFINGDEALPTVATPDGRFLALRETRQRAADRFNAGEIRFLISTEAGGEGIDLQHRCFRLVHVDLPWNPMRMHQRVGRLNRIGQKEVVHVTLFQNPATVEARIWELLNEKLKNITVSINQVTESPEDLTQLVLGIAGSAGWDSMFSEAGTVKRESLGSWFDAQTRRFEGREVIDTVKELIGHAQRFDYGASSSKVPQLDLPALEPFFRLSLRANRRQVSEQNGCWSFITPESWQTELGIRPRYDDVHFNRKLVGRHGGTVLGVGQKLFDCALNRARKSEAVLAVVNGPPGTVFVFRVFDRVTSSVITPASIIVAISRMAGRLELLDDAATLLLLNDFAVSVKPSSEGPPLPSLQDAGQTIAIVNEELRSKLPLVQVPFRRPETELLGIVVCGGQ